MRFKLKRHIHSWVELSAEEEIIDRYVNYTKGSTGFLDLTERADLYEKIRITHLHWICSGCEKKRTVTFDGPMSVENRLKVLNGFSRKINQL